MTFASYHHALRAKQWRRNLLSVLQLAPITIIIAGFLIVPLALAFWESIDGLELNFDRYLRVISEPIYLDVLVRSLEIGFFTTVICVSLGYPIAYFMTTMGRRGIAVFSIFLLVPLFTAFLIRTYGWIIILGRRGVLNTFLIEAGIIEEPLRILGTSVAVYIGLVHVLTPVAIFVMFANMVQLDRTLLKASQVLGAHPVRAFVRVYFPMSMPAIVSASVLIFIIAISFYITPVLLGGPGDTMISQLVVTQVTTLLDFKTGYAIAILLLLVTIATIALSNLFVPIEQMWAVKGSVRSRKSLGILDRVPGRTWVRAAFDRVLSTLENGLYAALRKPKWLAASAMRLFAVLFILFLIAPLLIIYVLSFNASPFLVFPPPGYSMRWYAEFFQNPDWRTALIQSGRIAVIVATISVVIGGSAAFAIVRSNVPAKRALILFFLTPLLVPVIVLAISLYISIGSINLIGSLPGLVIGHLVFSVPYAVIVLVGAIRNLDQNLEHAASTLGGPPTLVYRKIVFPILLPAILTAWLLSFLQSFDELLVTLFLLGRQTPTLPIKMWNDIQVELDPTMSAASSIIVTTVALIIVASQAKVLFARQEREERA